MIDERDKLSLKEFVSVLQKSGKREDTLTYPTSVPYPTFDQLCAKTVLIYRFVLPDSPSEIIPSETPCVKKG